MATQAPSRSIGPLIVATIIMNSGVIASGHVLAAEASEQTMMQPINPGDVSLQRNPWPSVDAVAEARWARQRDDYTLRESGQVVREEELSDAAETTTTSVTGADAIHNYFGSDVDGSSPCGPSPATPEQITQLVIEAAQRHKVDAGFAVAVATAESRLDRQRNSRAGARGPMQLIPETAERFGVTDICDPEQNIDGGVRYLRELTDEFRNPLLVAAAYNAGVGRVREHGGIPPFQETVGFVAEVLNIQMGLEGSGPATDEPRASDEEGQGPVESSGVITSRERRQWVGGVMHF